MPDLTPAELDAIEARQARCYIFDRPGDVWVSPEEDAYALLSALRAAWEERDRLRELVAEAFWEGQCWNRRRFITSDELEAAWAKSKSLRALTPPREGER